MIVERHGEIAILTLDRPDAMNPLGHKGDGAAIEAICQDLNADLSLRCAILTGAGRAFSAGGDVKAMADPESAFSRGGLITRDHYRNNIHRAARAMCSRGG